MLQFLLMALAMKAARIIEARKELNNNKVADLEGWKSEYVKYAGNSLLHSIQSLLKEIGRGEVPEELKTVLIKSIYKEKGKKDEMKNQRGICEGYYKTKWLPT